MHTSQFLRGMGLGIAVGTAIGVACMPKKRHPMKKKAQHAMKHKAARPSLRLRLKLHGPLPG